MVVFMRLRQFVILLLVLLILGCSTPFKMTEMRSEIETRLLPDESKSSYDTLNRPIDLSLGLLKLLPETVSSNDAYQSAIAIELEAMSQIEVASSLRRPQITASASFGGIRELETGSNDQTTTGVAGGVNLSQLIYDGGAAVSSMNLATAQALSKSYQRVFQANKVALDAAKSWIDLWQFTKRVELINARTSVMDTLVDQIERMARSGMLDRASVDSARRQIVDVKLAESRLQTSKVNALASFQRFFDTRPERIQKPVEFIGIDEVKEYTDKWVSSPLLQSKAADVLAAQASVNEAKAAFRPDVRLQTGARSPWEENESTDLTLGLMLEYTFNDGGRRYQELKSAEARMEAAKAKLSNQKSSLKVELEQGLSRLEAIESSANLLSEKLRLSRSEAEASRAQLLTGQSNLRFLVEAEIEIYRAQDQEIAMQAERHVLLLTIAAGTGVLAAIIDI